MNLSILKGFLMNEIFMKTMVATWKNVVSAADELMLPKLSKRKSILNLVVHHGNLFHQNSPQFHYLQLGF